MAKRRTAKGSVKASAQRQVSAEEGTYRCEFHFQEVFNGERVVLSKGGEVVADRAMKTRMQIGLADVVEVDVKPGDEIRAILMGAGQEARLVMGPHDPYVSVRMENGQLIMQRAEGMPRYA